MKILVCTIKPGMQGGIEAVSRDIHEKIALSNETEFFNYGGKDGETKWLKPLKRAFELFALAFITIRFKPDIIHLDTGTDKKAIFRDFFTTVLLKKILKQKVFVWYHGSTFCQLNSKSLAYSLLKFNVKKTDLVGVFPHAGCLDLIKNKIGKKEVEEVYTGHNLAKMSKEAKKAAHRVPRSFKILFSSRFITTKGTLEVVRAFAKAVKKQPNMSLLMVGSGGLYDEAVALANRLGIKKKIFFYGFVTPDLFFYKTSDILVLPTSHPEGYPSTITKALAFGLPIITSPIEPLKQTLKEKQNCLWCQAKKPDDIAEKIVHLYDQPRLRKQMGKNNALLGRRLFSDRSGAKRMTKIYQKIIANS